MSLDKIIFKNKNLNMRNKLIPWKFFNVREASLSTTICTEEPRKRKKCSHKIGNASILASIKGINTLNPYKVTSLGLACLFR
jgi:hypothetical protein